MPVKVLTLLTVVAVGLMTVAFGDAKVTVNTDCAYVVNGHREVHDMVFGATAYEGAPPPATECRESLRTAGVSCLGFPGNGAWCSPPESPLEEVLPWYQSDAAVREMTHAEPLNGARYMYGKILPAGSSASNLLLVIARKQACDDIRSTAITAYAPSSSFLRPPSFRPRSGVVLMGCVAARRPCPPILREA
jgi:hypothetical protein